MIPLELRRQHDDLGNAPELLTAEDAHRIEQGHFRRAAGDCVCVCGERYYDHPPVLGALWLTRVCDGHLYKL